MSSSSPPSDYPVYSGDQLSTSPGNLPSSNEEGTNLEFKAGTLVYVDPYCTHFDANGDPVGDPYRTIYWGYISEQEQTRPGYYLVDIKAKASATTESLQNITLIHYNGHEKWRVNAKWENTHQSKEVEGNKLFDLKDEPESDTVVPIYVPGPSYEEDEEAGPK